MVHCCSVVLLQLAKLLSIALVRKRIGLSEGSGWSSRVYSGFGGEGGGIFIDQIFVFILASSGLDH